MAQAIGEIQNTQQLSGINLGTLSSAGGTQTLNTGGYTKEAGDKYSTLAKDLDSIITKGVQVKSNEMKLTAEATSLTSNQMYVDYVEKANAIDSQEGVSASDKKAQLVALNGQYQESAAGTFDFEDENVRNSYTKSFNNKARIQFSERMSKYDKQIIVDNSNKILSESTNTLQTIGTGAKGMSLDEYVEANKYVIANNGVTEDELISTWVKVSLGTSSTEKAEDFQTSGDNAVFKAKYPTAEAYRERFVPNYEDLPSDLQNLANKQYEDLINKANKEDQQIQNKIDSDFSESTDSRLIDVSSVSDAETIIKDIKNINKDKTSKISKDVLLQKLNSAKALANAYRPKAGQGKDILDLSLDNFLGSLELKTDYNAKDYDKFTKRTEDEEQLKKDAEILKTNIKVIYGNDEKKLDEVDRVVDKAIRTKNDLIQYRKTGVLIKDEASNAVKVMKRNVSLVEKEFTETDLTTEEGFAKGKALMQNLLRSTTETPVQSSILDQADKVFENNDFSSLEEAERMNFIATTVIENTNQVSSTYKSLHQRELVTQIERILRDDSIEGDEKLKLVNMTKRRHTELSRAKVNQAVSKSGNWLQERNENWLNSNMSTKFSNILIARHIEKTGQSPEDFDDYDDIISDNSFIYYPSVGSSIVNVFEDDGAVSLPNVIGSHSKYNETMFDGFLKFHDKTVYDINTEVFEEDGKLVVAVFDKTGAFIDLVDDNSWGKYYRKGIE